MENIKERFIEVFNETDQLRAFFAPGRVNLIGEHTDYNGGHVFPCALSVGTFAVARKRNDSRIRLYSMNFSDVGVIETSLEKLEYVDEHDWANYPKGVVAKLLESGADIATGFDVVFNGTIPNGAGLSSSASIELVTAVIMNELYQLAIDQVELVKLAQKAENEFIGVQCGIMDQFAIGMGKKDHAILLDCQTLQATYSPIKLEDMSLVIINTNKKRGLADSKYNERRSECQQALEQLQKVVAIDSLGDLSTEAFESRKHVIENETVQKRAKHAVYENERTVLAVEKLRAGDLVGFGKLMNESHISLRDDYEVTGHELDALVQAAWDAGAVGARMTGAGFGGCTVNLVDKEQLATFIDQVGLQYEQQTGLKADFYTVEIGDQAREIAL
ncbi:galactokinase [Halalkalibacter kiskunsagensis]|uniref:Galactokinase n=1 Tax=Halalkalibacter kiskunsagensis TaxID=1548599 RepID=A0ABV6KGI9_9BACI